MFLPQELAIACTEEAVCNGFSLLTDTLLVRGLLVTGLARAL